MRIRRRDLAAPIGAIFLTGRCMLPRSEMLRADVHHARMHRELNTFAGDVFGEREHVVPRLGGRCGPCVQRWEVGTPGVDREILTVGWDWQVDCTIERCQLHDGPVCC